MVNAKGNNLQIISPDVYDMTTGSITFAFTLPGVNLAQIYSMSIVEPFISGASGQAQVQLYDWTTASWNTIALTNVSFNTGNTQAYISPDGHVLLQVATRTIAPTGTISNQHASTGTILFEKPSLSLNS